MKSAILHIAVIEFTCPECGENLSSKNGSHLFPLNEELPNEIECSCCGIKLKIPTKAKKLQN